MDLGELKAEVSKKLYVQPNEELINKDYLQELETKCTVSMNELFLPILNKHINSTKVKHLFMPFDKFVKRFKINSTLLDVMRPLWDSPDGANIVLAGGKLQDWFCGKEDSTNDYDIFFTNRMAQNYSLDLFERSILEGNFTHKGYLSEYEFDGNKYQLIHKEYSDPEEIISNFDIRACSICTNGQFVWWIKGCLHDIRDKKIVYLNPQESINHFIRIEKYIKKGYSITACEFTIAAIKTLEGVLLRRDHHKIKEVLLNRKYVFNQEDVEYESMLGDAAAGTGPALSHINEQIEPRAITDIAEAPLLTNLPRLEETEIEFF